TALVLDHGVALRDRLRELQLQLRITETAELRPTLERALLEELLAREQVFDAGLADRLLAVVLAATAEIALFDRRPVVRGAAARRADGGAHVERTAAQLDRMRRVEHGEELVEVGFLPAADARGQLRGGRHRQRPTRSLDGGVLARVAVATSGEPER